MPVTIDTDTAKLSKKMEDKDESCRVSTVVEVQHVHWYQTQHHEYSKKYYLHNGKSDASMFGRTDFTIGLAHRTEIPFSPQPSGEKSPLQILPQPSQQSV